MGRSIAQLDMRLVGRAASIMAFEITLEGTQIVREGLDGRTRLV